MPFLEKMANIYFDIICSLIKNVKNYFGTLKKIISVDLKERKKGKKKQKEINEKKLHGNYKVTIIILKSIPNTQLKTTILNYLLLMH